MNIDEMWEKFLGLEERICDIESWINMHDDISDPQSAHHLQRLRDLREAIKYDTKQLNKIRKQLKAARGE